MKNSQWYIFFAALLALGACSQASEIAPSPTPTPPDRLAAIPPGAGMILPENDLNPPLVLLPGYSQPVPLPASINTPGAEDSPFITPDGNTLYFFFTPDMNIPAQEQILDGVTGIYVVSKMGDTWGQPERVMLQEQGRLAMDGCAFVQGQAIWFCSAREGFMGVRWFTAEYQAGRWQGWQPAAFPPAYQVGELHISADGNQLYFHSERPGGQGQLDIWMSENVMGAWQEPVNLAVVNTPDSEGWPALSPDGSTLWFTRNFGIWRSLWNGEAWGEPELVISPLAGEPTLDAAGNIYFVHHYLVDGDIVQADLFVALKIP